MYYSNDQKPVHSIRIGDTYVVKPLFGSRYNGIKVVAIKPSRYSYIGKDWVWVVEKENGDRHTFYTKILFLANIKEITNPCVETPIKNKAKELYWSPFKGKYV